METATLVRELGARCEAFACDVTRKSDVDATAATVLRDVGDVDILVNNAGLCPM